jgi:diguanylate cyclase (GGDEF)-like protein
MMLDLDGFKHCNDTRGHLFGDRMLRTVAEVLLGTVRSMDVVARFGGDEFLVILPETSQSVAATIAERLRNNIASKAQQMGAGAVTGPDMLTASIGIACYPEHGKTVEHLLEHVDKALYRAKNKGKNRIEVYA